MRYYGIAVPNKIQPREYSMGSGLEDISYKIWTVNANWNAENGWNVDANSVENPNEWNAGNQVLSKLASFKDPQVMGSLFVFANHRAFFQFQLMVVIG